MPEVPERSAAQPSSAAERQLTQEDDPTVNNDDTSIRARQHVVLQQVLELLKDPLIPIPEAGNNEAVQKLHNQNKDLRAALSKMSGLLRDKTGKCVVLERKVAALDEQVSSLKDVVVLTKDLLNIRNMEVQHLQLDISAVQEGLDNQKKRYNQTITKLDLALKLNATLKDEYQTQLRLFQDLRGKYEERAQLMERKNENELSQKEEI